MICKSNGFMKGILKFSALAVITAFALTSCAKEETRLSTSENSLHFIINTAENVELKSFIDNNHNGTYTPKWSKGDKLAIFVGDITTSTIAPTATLSNTAETGITASFDGTVPIDLKEGSFLSFSPAGAFAKGYLDGTVGINLSEIQKPSSSTIDEKCDVLVAKPCDFTAENGTVAINDLFFKRIFSIVKVNLKGVEALNGEKVTSFTLSAPATLTGSAAVNLSTASISQWNTRNESVVAKYTTDNPAFGGENGLKNTVWLVVNPITVTSGSKVTFSGETENYTFSKDVTLSEDLVFPQSQMAVINLTIGEGNYTAKTPEWVSTDFADLKAGDKVVIVRTSETKYAMTNDQGTSAAPKAQAVTVVNNKLVNTPESNIVWYVGVDGSNKIFYTSSKKTSWLYCTSTNNGVRVGDNTNKTFTYDNNYLKHVGTSRYLGVYNNADWRCYTNNTVNIENQTFGFFVEQSGSSEGGSDPVKLDAPEVSCTAQTETSLTFSWAAVANASGYQVSVDGGNSYEATQVETSYTWTGLTVGTTKTLYVKAIGDGTNYTNSDAASAEGKTTAGSGGGANTTTLSNANITAVANPNNSSTQASGYRTLTYTDDNGFKYSAYAISTFHSKATNQNCYIQIKKYASNTAYYVKLPDFKGNIKSIHLVVSGSSKTMDGGGNTATIFFSSSDSTSEVGANIVSGKGDSEITIDASSLNLNTGYLTASGAVRIWEITVEYSN